MHFFGLKEKVGLKISINRGFAEMGADLRGLFRWIIRTRLRSNEFAELNEAAK